MCTIVEWSEGDGQAVTDNLTEFDPGQLVVGGTFRITRLLGSGATSHVYAAELVRKPGAHVALKVLRESFRQHPSVLRRFQREGDVVKLLNSPFVNRLLGAGVSDDGPLWMALRVLRR